MLHPLRQLLRRSLGRCRGWALLHSSRNPSPEEQQLLQQLLQLWPSLKHLAVFVRYGAGRTLPPWQSRFLAELADLGWLIWVMDHSPQPLSLSALKGCGAQLYLQRPNQGMCVGAFAHAIELLHRCCDSSDPTAPLVPPTSLALINDSFLPLLPLHDTPPLNRLLSPGINDDRIRGLTESCEQSYHLQSYLLVLGGQAWLSPASRLQWQRCLQLAGRQQVIAAGEVGLSQCWQEQGLQLEPVLPLSVLAAAGRTRIPVERNDCLSALQQNAYLVYWRELLQLSGVFKKSTLTDLHQSRISQATLQDFLEVASSAGVHDPASVIDHLVRHSTV
ncbi:MAG: hypothetical protein VKM34_06530 [Cyanobacteriota bacterium]|nr:hypothetical protein [Cyanobacteriota bacterium]